MSKKKNNSTLSSILVLTIICLVVTGALVATYQVTAPIIEANKEVGGDALADLLPGSGGAFSEVVADMNDGILEVLAADNGEGFIFTVSVKGFGGEILGMVGVNKDNEVTGVEIVEHAETPDLGTQAFEPEFIEQFIGSTAITIKGEDGKTQIDAVAGATISCDAVFKLVDAALQQFDKMGGSV